MKQSAFQFIKKIRQNYFQLIALLLIIFGINTQTESQTHLLLSEVTLQPVEGEFIEIYNPTNSSIGLDNYYLADNQEYPYLPSGAPNLDLGDFIVRFPTGHSINSNETLVIANNGSDFEGQYGQLADFEIQSGNADTPDMIIISQISPSITNAGEGIVLFYWNGTNPIVKDVDLMNVGIPNESNEIVDKTDIPGYLPDAHTIPYQDQTGPAGNGFSTKRILFEGGIEINTGGNGITGDDETSEDISITWDEIYTIPTPGSTTLIISGIETPSELKHLFSIYPNPASLEITLNIKSHTKNYSIQIANVHGAVVNKLKFSNTRNGLIYIDLSNLTSGIYFLTFISDNETSTQKLIVK